MSEFELDIETWISEKFKSPERVKIILDPLRNLNTAVNISRVVRCVLMLSESDYDSLEHYVKKAAIDFRDVIWISEYDNRNTRKYNFNFGLYSQQPYTYSE